MESTRHFKPPWTLIRENSECYTVQDANGVTVAWLYCRDDSQRYSFGASKLTSEEARRIGKAISRIPEFMTQRQGFHRAEEGHAGALIGPIMLRWRTLTFALTGTELTRCANSTACRSIRPARPSRTTGYGRSTNLPGRWMPSCFGIASRAAGCAAANFTIQSDRPICRPLKPLQNWPKFNPRNTR